VPIFPPNQVQVQPSTENSQVDRRHLWALQALSSRISTASDLDQLLDELIQGVRSIFHANVMIFLMDEEKETFYPAAAGGAAVSSERPLDADEFRELAVHIGEAEALLLVHDATGGERSGVPARMSVPMSFGGRLVGVLEVENDRVAAFEERDLQLMITLANQAAAAVANARLLQEIQQQRRALARQSQEMAEESSKLEAVLNTMADGLVVSDLDGVIMVSNPAFREMAGLPMVHSSHGGSLAESFPLEGLESLLTRALETPDRMFTQDLELADGRVFKISTTTWRVPPPVVEPERGDRIAGVVTIFRDITHEVEVDRVKTAFISTISHELRSPLTSIVGFTDLIQRDFERWIVPHLDGKADQIAQRMVENLSIIENESRRLSQLIGDMLDVARIESGPVEGAMGKVAMGEVIQDAVATVAAWAREKGLDIQVQLAEDLPLVRGHYDRLIQVVAHLLSNAIKFTHQGEIRISAAVVRIPEGDGPEHAVPELVPGEWLTVHVADTGVGIQAQQVPHMFAKFTQVGGPLSGKPAGTGLGLAICKGIVAYHGGYIWVKSEPGRGSTFSFALPTGSDPV